MLTWAVVPELYAEAGPTGCNKQKCDSSVVFRRLLFLFPFLILGLARLYSVCSGLTLKTFSALFMLYFSK